jgi:glycosyltransferase involved in cell wall biosynthesis
MKIVQLNTYDIRGGAARAAYRLHQGLLKIGQSSQMVVAQKSSTDETVFEVNLGKVEESVEKQLLLGAAIQEYYINVHRTEISNTLFSLPYPGYDLSALPMLHEAEVINLHWVAYYQSLTTLNSLFALGKPIIWTLHDQWAFTGGCHYTAGCQKYRQDCVACPQLAEDLFNLAATILKDKLELFKGANLTIITPSRWLAKCAKQSKLFGDLRVEVIPYALDTDIFYPIPKAKAKKNLGIEAEVVTLLFVAEHSIEKRKGFQELVAALQHCLDSRGFQELVQCEKIKLLCLGHSGYKDGSLGIPAVFLGYLDSNEEIRTAYAAADLFILPSLEDNLPNTILESMSCGTPVVAFDVGGVPDVVTNGVTGQLACPGDVSQMGEAIVSLVLNPEQREEMGKRCRQQMIEKNSLTDQAERYLQLYQELRQKDELSAREASEDSTLEREAVGTQIASTTPLVSVGTAKGPHFSGIFDQVLLKALKEFSLAKEKAYQASEADRAARLQVIEDLGRRLGEFEAERDNLAAELADLRQQFESVEADRAARLEVIEQQGRRLGELETERDKLQAERDGFLQLLLSVSKTRTYKLLLKLGRWKAIEQKISKILEDSIPPAE